MSIVRLPIYEIIKDTVTHPSKVLCYALFTDLFVCRSFYFAIVFDCKVESS